MEDGADDGWERPDEAERGIGLAQGYAPLHWRMGPALQQTPREKGASDRAQRLADIVDQIVGVFDSDREPNQVIGRRRCRDLRWWPDVR